MKNAKIMKRASLRRGAFFCNQEDNNGDYPHHIDAHQQGQDNRPVPEARLDYVKNPDKTEQGKLISAYACAPETADQEFLLNRNAYIAKTGRRIR